MEKVLPGQALLTWCLEVVACPDERKSRCGIATERLILKTASLSDVENALKLERCQYVFAHYFTLDGALCLFH